MNCLNLGIILLGTMGNSTTLSCLMITRLKKYLEHLPSLHDIFSLNLDSNAEFTPFRPI